MPAGGTESVGDGTTAVACAGATNVTTVLHAITTAAANSRNGREAPR